MSLCTTGHVTHKSSNLGGQHLYGFIWFLLAIRVKTGFIDKNLRLLEHFCLFCCY